MKKNYLLVLLMLVASTAIIALVLPRSDKPKTFNYEKDRPWLNETLIAPFDIPIELTEEDKKRKTDSLNNVYVPFVRHESELAKQYTVLLSQELAKYKDVPVSVRQQLLKDVKEAYARGIVDNKTGEFMAKGRSEYVRLLNANSVVDHINIENLRTVRQVYEMLDTTYDKAEGAVTERFNVANFLAPNYVYDKVENDKYYKDALSRELEPKESKVTGEAIIKTGDIVTPKQDAIIKKLESMLQENAEKNNLSKKVILTGQIMLVAIMLLMYVFFLSIMRRQVFNNMRSMLFLFMFITLFIVCMMAIVKFRANFLYLVPYALVPIIISAFFDLRIAFLSHIVVVLICSLAAPEQAQFIIMQFLAGCVAVALMQELTRRSHLVLCALLIFAVYGVTHLAIMFSRGIEFLKIDWHTYIYYAVNCIALSFAYVAIFVVEKLFGFTSLLTMVELSDINTPLLRLLSEKCPGTFQHSLQVANIAAEAAIKVGASQQMVRAGALYHDIGKIENPAFFTENQNRINPHDALAPEQSAQIVIKHVLDGIRLADKARLPQVIKDLIVQHHGDSTTRYFYMQACKEAGDEAVDPTPYTYPGPRPQTKEAAIIMMADSCEAATKSLSEYTEESITGVVNKIIDLIITSGQLKDSPISFKQVEIVRQVFVERLKSIYHTRISYPDDIKPKE